MAKTKKQQTKSLPDLLREFAKLFRQLPEKFYPKVPAQPNESMLAQAGSHIRTILEIGGLPEIGNRLLPTFDNLRIQQSAKEAYLWLWQQTLKILRRRYELCPPNACIESFVKDCRFVAEELDKESIEALSLASTKQNDSPMKGARVWNYFLDLYEKTLKAFFDSFLGKVLPK